MSRISKRKQFLQSSAKQKDRELFYRTAIYTRLSSLFREKGESQSTQIEIARQYIKEKNQDGDYIEKLFPLLGVRFISAADNFDTGEREGGSRHLEVHMKNLVHEMYARDFSKKAKLQQRRENGSYIGGHPPYGYGIKWINHQKILVPDEAAAVVRMIYNSFLKRNSCGAVARLLNEKNKSSCCL